MAAVRLTDTRLVPRHGFASDGPRFLESNAIPAHAVRKLTPLLKNGTSLGFRPRHWNTSTTIGLVETSSDSGIVSALATSRSSQLPAIPPWIINRVALLELNHGSIAMYLTHLAHAAAAKG